MTAIKPPFQYFGGKTRIAEQIAALLPPHGHYVEPFAGSLAVLLAKRPAPMETVNDLSGDIVHFWRMLRERPDDIERVCALTPHSRAEHQLSYEPAEDDIERARRTWVRLTQGRSGQIRQRTGWRYHVKPGATGMPAYLSAYVARLHPGAQRLSRVSIECRPAIEIIRAYGQHPGVLIYADPPYPESVRSHARFGDVYAHEMREDDGHRELAEALLECRAAVVLSGYDSPLYDELYGAWGKTSLSAYTGNGLPGEGVRTEVLWSNRPFPQATLFDGLEAS
jgi:DNA adenine methylase